MFRFSYILFSKCIKHDRTIYTSFIRIEIYILTIWDICRQFFSLFRGDLQPKNGKMTNYGKCRRRFHRSYFIDGFLYLHEYLIDSQHDRKIEMGSFDLQFSNNVVFHFYSFGNICNMIFWKIHLRTE